jgi:glycosyltransferase involved in cell wall biosynthesis
MNSETLTILGVQLEDESYPNVLHRVNALESCQNIQVKKIHYCGWVPNTQSSSGRSRILRNFWQMLHAHLIVLLRYLRIEGSDCTYIPYPATIILWSLSLIPSRCRDNRIVVDAFISLYDTIVLDRKLVDKGSLLAKLLYSMERRAFRYADAVIVDTKISAEHLSNLFGLPKSSFYAVPLSTDEVLIQPSEYRPSNDICRVLFVGTLIPLHGVATIVAAAKILHTHKHIKIKVIGDGQDNSALMGYSKLGESNLEWERRWLNSTEIAEEITAADICLGIFGSTEKTQRVLPLKLYAYARSGRCIITANTTCCTEYTSSLDYEPWYAIPEADPESLAKAIFDLAENTELRSTLAFNAGNFYMEHLSNKAAEEILMKTLFPTQINHPTYESA